MPADNDPRSFVIQYIERRHYLSARYTENKLHALIHEAANKKLSGCLLFFCHHNLRLGVFLRFIQFFLMPEPKLSPQSEYSFFVINSPFKMAVGLQYRIWC